MERSMKYLSSRVLLVAMSVALSACGGGSSSSSSTSISTSRDSIPGFSSVEVGEELPLNGTRPVETLCQAGSFARITSEEGSCPAEQFRIFEDQGFLAEEGFHDGSPVYFYEAGIEDYQNPSVINNALSLNDISVGGQEQSYCVMFCLDDNQTVQVFCTAPGKIVCNATNYARVPDAPAEPVVTESPEDPDATDASEAPDASTTPDLGMLAPE